MAFSLDFSHFTSELNPATRSLTVTLPPSSIGDKEQDGTYLSFKCLEELESLFNWLSSRVEISSVLIQSSGAYFCKGMSPHELANSGQETLIKYFEKVGRLVSGAYFLPQTLIVDLGQGAFDVGSELALIGDIRISRSPGHVHFDHLSKGLAPTAGGVAVLSSILSPSHVRNYLLGGAPISSEDMKLSGLVFDTYQDRIERENLLSQLLERINAQSPIARIQAKRALLETILKQLEIGMSVERSVTFGTLAFSDWKTYAQAKLANEKPSFAKANQLAAQIKRSAKETSAQN